MVEIMTRSSRLYGDGTGARFTVTEKLGTKDDGASGSVRVLFGTVTVEGKTEINYYLLIMWN